MFTHYLKGRRMKSVPVKSQPQSLHSIIKSSIVTRKDRQTKLRNVVEPPTEEIINTLNELSRQYPYCVNFKQKRHDPL